MAKFRISPIRMAADYLSLVIDNDWKGEDEEVFVKETDHRGREVTDRPDEQRWQYARGQEAFWAGRPLRYVHRDGIHFDDSRRLWRAGWVAGLKEFLAARGVVFDGTDS